MSNNFLTALIAPRYSNVEDLRLPLTAQSVVYDFLGDDDGDLFDDDFGAGVDLDIPLSASGFDDDEDIFGDEGDFDAWMDSDLPLTAAPVNVHYLAVDGDDDDDLLGADDEGDDDDLLGDDGDDDSMGFFVLLPLGYAAIAAIAGGALAKGPMTQAKRKRLFQALPYMDRRTLNGILKNPFRSSQVKRGVRREIARRQQGGQRARPVDEPQYDTQYEPQYDTQYSPQYSPQYRQPQHRPHHNRPHHNRPGQVAPRRQPKAQQSHVTHLSRPQAPPKRSPGPWLNQRTRQVAQTQPGSWLKERIQQGQRVKVAKKRTRFGDDGSLAMMTAPDGYDLTPKLSSAAWHHPVQATLVTGAAFAVGAAVGGDRVLDALGVVGSKVRNLFGG